MENSPDLTVEQATENLGETVKESLSHLIPSARKLNYLALVCVIFFTVSGGAFGIEPLVGKMGAGLAIILILITPLLWSLPIALMVSELSSAMPEEGGYYIWVKRALGNFWGVQEGWWTVCYTAVDMAIYPVLFVNYLAFFFPSLALGADGSSSWQTFFLRWGICASMIIVALVINWRGAKAVGNNAMFNALLVLLPFALLVIFGLSQENSLNNSWEAMKASFGNIPPAGLIAVGLATVLWNYSAWDNVSTFAGEVNEAEKNYPRALMSTLPLTICAYLLPVFIGIGITADESIWNESAGFPALATIISGEWLGLLIAIAALLSAWSLFNSQLLYVSRMPFVMARDGWLPSILTKTSETTGVPINALLLSCGISLIFCALPFGKLVVIDILLYSAALVLEFIALLVLRKREPEMNRPFKIKGGWTVLILLTLAPTAFASIVLFATLSDPEIDYRQVLAVVLAMVSGVVLYFLRRGKIDQESQA